MRFTSHKIDARLPAALAAAAAAVAIAIPAAASAAAMKPKIENGQSAAQGQVPWSSVALIQINSPSGMAVCTGTVVAPQVVLTAGHCAVDETSHDVNAASRYTVMTGSASWGTDPLTNTTFSPGPGGTLSSVSAVVPEPSFAYNGSNLPDRDVALLQLSAPVSAPPIQLATAADTALYAANSSVEVGGWGITSPNANDIPENLQWVASTVASQAYCQSSDGTDFDAADQICIHNTTSAGACPGDSGGPTFATNASGTPVEIGVTSYGPASSCNTTFEANVSVLDGWLSQEIRALSPVAAPTSPAPNPTGATSPGGPPTSSGSTKPRSVKKPLAGEYRGITARHGRIGVKVSADRVQVDEISLRVPLRCSRAAHLQTYALTTRSRHRLTGHNGFALSGSSSPAGHAHYKLTGRFSAHGSVRGALKVRASRPRVGTCTSGTLHWTARI